MKTWIKSGAPWIWMNAAAVSTSLIMVAGLLGLIALRGLGHFWPADVVEMDYLAADGEVVRLIGELGAHEDVPRERLAATGVRLPGGDTVTLRRYLLKTGNRDVAGPDFMWVLGHDIQARRYPPELVAIERREWGNFYGYLREVRQAGASVASGDQAWDALQPRLQRALDLFAAIRDIERGAIGSINYRLEQLRLRTRRLELDGRNDPAALADIAAERAGLQAEYEGRQQQLADLYRDIARDSIVVETQAGQQVELPLSKIVHIRQPNAMGMFTKLKTYFAKVWEFLSDEPREANTEGGIFPAIFGTVLMVILMSVLVTPFGVIAALYLREYAKQGPVTRMIRIAVNNLAGVPSIVYGVFGLGFFVYFLGGNIDRLFYPEAQPAPTFGTPGLLWASITLALLTLPVVIVATEEGLARIPKAIREGSLALGATKAETLWRTVLPMASPAMMTGLILAVARAAGEVAPLMLVGVVKLAPTLPLDGNAPFLHLDRKFMHLGFHIYDVGFQSPNVEAARPLVYATALLLVLVIMVLNIAAITLRNRLREKYRALDQ
ncbi:MAG: phosphate ABC transporter permease PstA [Thiohalobacteraceae bacterium]